MTSVQQAILRAAPVRPYYIVGRIDQSSARLTSIRAGPPRVRQPDAASEARPTA
jgi:hypothetical protein